MKPNKHLILSIMGYLASLISLTIACSAYTQTGYARFIASLIGVNTAIIAFVYNVILLAKTIQKRKRGDENG